MKHIFLIVDDDENSLQVTVQELRLRHSDADYHVARSGSECMEALKRINSDAIFMDLALPAMDGWQTLQSVRAGFCPGYRYDGL